MFFIFFFKEKAYILWPSIVTSRNASRWNIKGASHISLQGRSLTHNIQSQCKHLTTRECCVKTRLCTCTDVQATITLSNVEDSLKMRECQQCILSGKKFTKLCLVWFWWNASFVHLSSFTATGWRCSHLKHSSSTPSPVAHHK